MITEVNEDLFKLYESQHDKKNIRLVQCISSDFAMAAGIAVQFNKKYDVKNIMKREFIPYWDGVGYCRDIYKYGAPVYNLITKEYCFYKPTNDSLQEALLDMRKQMISSEIPITALMMPKIGCGIDGLNWETVKSMIDTTFPNTPIVVCYI